MNRKILFVIIALAFLGYVLYAFQSSVTPYVGIAEAETSTSSVQVKGLLDKTAPAPHMDGDDFVFTLADENDGKTMVVRYHGQKPDQFDQAHHIVAIGTYANDKDAFVADKLLIKCPSKYENSNFAHGKHPVRL